MYMFFYKPDVYKHTQAQVWKWFFMWINYLCISYVLFVYIFIRSFDDFISMKFLIEILQPLRLLTLEIFANFPFYCTLLFIILAEICQPPCLFRPLLQFETREYTHNHALGILIWQCPCHRNGKQNSESFFNYDTNLTSVITMELKFIFFFLKF